MSIKTNGAEFKAWINSDWRDPAIDGDGEDPWWEDEVVCINGVDQDDIILDRIADTDTVVLKDGVIRMGYGFDAPSILAVTHFKRWRKKQAFTRLLIEVHKDDEQKVRDFVKTLKGKVL